MVIINSGFPTKAEAPVDEERVLMPWLITLPYLKNDHLSLMTIIVYTDDQGKTGW